MADNSASLRIFATGNSRLSYTSVRKESTVKLKHGYVGKEGIQNVVKFITM